jgi:hypothetical protein
MAKILSAADILALPDKIESRQSELLGGIVYIKKHSIENREKIFDFFETAKKTEGDQYKASDFWALLIELCVVDESGKPIFSSEQIQILKSKSEDYFNELKTLVESVLQRPTKENIEEVKENLEQTQ